MSDNDLILYSTEDGEAQFNLRELSDQLWLTQLEVADLYQTSKHNISRHVKCILNTGELAENSVANQKLTTAADKESFMVLFTTVSQSIYNLFTTHPLQHHLVDRSLGRKNRLGYLSSGGFFI